MNEMLERAASVIGSQVAITPQHAEQIARAVIEAIREPADDVVSAVETANECATERNIDEGGPGRGLYFDEKWKTAIDAILADGDDS